MRKQLRALGLLLAFCAATFLFSCGGSENANKEAKTDTTAAPPPKTDTVKPPAGPTLPYNAMVVKHTVANFAVWKPLFDSDSTARNVAGLHTLTVARGIMDTNNVVIPFMIDDVAKAKAFGADPRLKDVMKKGGVNSAPDIKFIKVMRMAETMKPGEFVEISHKVKDFDAWLKVFDAEGPAARAKDGLIDGVLARGIDDPNLVYLVFMITNLDSAKKAGEKPERQKLMKDGGVIGKPEVYFGKDVK